MTALGKTLVIFNLLFALITGWLIMTVYVTRTNWKIGMEEAQKETKAAQAAAKAADDQRRQDKAAWTALEQKLTLQIDQLQKNIAGKQAEINNQTAQAEAAKKQFGEQLALTEAASREIAKLQIGRASCRERV